MTEEQAEELSKGLPTGWIARVRTILASKGKTYDNAFISRVKNGKKQNADIEEALLTVASDEAARKQALSDRIKAAIAH